MSETFFALIGLVVGAAIAAAGFLYRKRLENLSRINEALFQLLELYGAIQMAVPVSIDQDMEWYLEVAQEVFPDEPFTQNKDLIKAEIIPIILEASKKITPAGETHLLEEYKNAIAKIAPIAPVLAYRLSINQILKSSLSRVDQYNENVKELLADKISKEDHEYLDFALNTIRNRISKDVSSRLRKDIVMLSIRCGFFSFFSIFKNLYMTKSQTREEFMKSEYRWILLETKRNLQAKPNNSFKPTPHRGVGHVPTLR